MTTEATETCGEWTRRARRWPRRRSVLALLVAMALSHAVAGASPNAPAASDRAVYPWTYDAGDEALDARFAAPAGFDRVDVEAGSFGSFVRSLPLRPEETPVVDYRGRVVRAAGDPSVAAVVDIDVGESDLEQCADFVIRLDAEWRYGRGERAIAYGTASGERLAFDGSSRSAAGHAAFRRYLDRVFARANTASLAREGHAVPLAEVRPGDVLVATGQPFGHAVLVLDVARGPDGKRALLLGQGYMPAQSFHVLRSATGPWFVLDAQATGVVTPFWRPFPASALRRL